MEIKEEDLIFEEDLTQEHPEGEKVLANGEEFTIKEFINSKQITDNLGFPVNYSWYKAEDSLGDIVNLFFFDEDLDSIESNDQVAEKWFNSVYNNSENF